MEPVRILLDTYAEPQELEAVRKVAKEGGLEAEVEGGYRKAKPGEAWGEGDEPEWIIVILVSSTFGAFFVRFFGEAGADAWKELKKLATRLRDSRRRPTGPSIPPSPPHLGAIHFRDQYGNEIREGLRPTMPPNEFWQAWDSISEPDWSALEGWFVFWDYDRKAWAAFEPRLDQLRAVHWDREGRQWVEYEPHPVTAFEPPPSRIDRIKRFFSRRKV